MNASIDDTDPRIRYSAGWKKKGTAFEFNGTTHCNWDTPATFKFNFTGTSISVYATVGDASSTSSIFQIDGTIPGNFTHPKVNSPWYKQLFFTSDTLPNGQHTLVGGCSQKGSYMCLDYLVVSSPLPSPLTLAATMPIPISTTTVTIPTSMTTVLDLPTAQTNPAVSGSNPHFVVGYTVGAALGGAAFTLILAYFVWLYIRRKSEPPSKSEPSRDNEWVLQRSPTSIYKSELSSSHYDYYYNTKDPSYVPKPDTLETRAHA